ncbi:hypothetical protein CYMTET_34233, partial [Cymbomonas tetramitiformis]
MEGRPVNWLDEGRSRITRDETLRAEGGESSCWRLRLYRNAIYRPLFLIILLHALPGSTIHTGAASSAKLSTEGYAGKGSSDFGNPISVGVSSDGTAAAGGVEVPSLSDGLFSRPTPQSSLWSGSTRSESHSARVTVDSALENDQLLVQDETFKRSLLWNKQLDGEALHEGMSERSVQEELAQEFPQDLPRVSTVKQQGNDEQVGPQVLMPAAVSKQIDNVNLAHLVEQQQELVTFEDRDAILYGSVFYSPFYEFYEFYEFYDFYNFYDVGWLSGGEPQALEAEQPILQICAIALSPSIGPETGGTQVSVLLSGVLSSGHEVVYCKFGKQVVLASKFRVMSGSQSLSIACIAPPRDDDRDVTLHISLDGKLFSIGGAPFHYHESLEIADITPSYSNSLVGGTLVVLEIKENDDLGGVFGGGFDSSVVTIPASCYFGPEKVDAIFNPDTTEVSCVAPPSLIDTQVEVRVSLDGQVYSVNSVLFTYGEPSKKVSVARAPMTSSSDVILDYLPFSPDNCVFYEVGDHASLQEIHLSHGDLQPQFEPGIFEYFMLLSTDSTEDMVLRIRPVAAHAGAMITLGGEHVMSNRTVPVLLRVGENKLLIAVTSSNRLTTRTYVITVYVLMDHVSGTSLSFLVPSHGDLDPEFSSDEYKYSTVVSYDKDEITFLAASIFNDPVSVCLVNAPEAQLRELWVGPPRESTSRRECYVTPSGELSPQLPLDVGFNLFELQATTASGGALASGPEVLYEFPPPPPPLATSTVPSTPPPDGLPDDYLKYARPVLRLTSGSPGFPAASDQCETQYQDEGTFERDFKTFNNLPPATSGQVAVYLGGSRCEAGDLSSSSSFSGALSGSFSATKNQVGEVTTVLRTATIFYDRSDVSLRYAARDVDGRPEVLTSGLTVTLVLTNSGTSATVSVECDTPDSNGLGDCEYSSSSHLSWFSTSADVAATVQVTFVYSGTTSATSATTALTLSQEQPYTALSSAGMSVTLPMSARLRSETFQAQITAHTNDYAMSSFKLTFTFDTAALQYKSVSISSLFNDPTVNTESVSSGSLQLVVVGVASGTTDAEVTSNALDLGYVKFKVQSSADYQAYTSSMSMFINEMVNTGTFTFLSNVDAQMNGEVSGAQTVAQVSVMEIVSVGMYAYLTVGELFNTAVLTGTAVTSTASMFLVYTYSSDTAISGTPTCALDGTYSSVVGVAADGSSCVVTADSSHTEGASSATFDVSFSGYTAALGVRVWFPGAVRMRAEDALLNRVYGAYQEGSCGSPRFQRTELCVNATFGGSGLADATVDVTCLLTFASSDTSVATVSGSTVQGTAAGGATISITGGASAATLAITVDSTGVNVTYLGGVLTTGGSWQSIANPSLDPSASFTGAVTLQQTLTAEGDSGEIFFYANFSDGFFQEVALEDGLVASVADGYSSSLEVAATSTGYTGTVPVGGVGGNDFIVVGTWVDSCTGGQVGLGYAPVLVDLASPVSATVTSQYTRITRASDAASATPISVSTSSELTVTMTFSDSSTTTFTTDSRTVYTVAVGADMVTIEDTNVVTPIESATANGTIVVNVTFPTYAPGIFA